SFKISALVKASAYSSCSLDKLVIPPPTSYLALFFILLIDTVRIGTLNVAVLSGVINPIAPQYTCLDLFSSLLIKFIVPIFGVPAIDPQGNNALKILVKDTLGFNCASIVEDI